MFFYKHKPAIYFYLYVYLKIKLYHMFRKKENYNIFTQGAKADVMPVAGLYGKELVAMVTYSDLFTFVIMLCAVITLVITIIKRKK